MQTRKTITPFTPLEGIAVIGLGCRLPGGINTAAAYWQLLKQGEVAVSSQDRFKHPQLSSRGGFLDHIDQFDPTFFNISPREANFIDPQQRLLLEVSWEALEHANLKPRDLAGSQTGVFVGIYAQDYLQLLKQHYEPTLYINTGNAFATACGRVAHFFDFRGPTFAVDTASSASLVAVHLACQSLWSGEADLALAAGVNLMLSPDLSLAFQKAGMLAKDGRCKSFDASADGYVRGEGCGVVVLKRLSEALADGDNILAVVRSSAMNQDGASNGLTAPNQEAQEAVIRQALHRAGLQPYEVDYVEAHGSGTPVGDPIEGQALQATYASQPRPYPLLVGSVKTNLGHLESAAGIAGFMKAVLAIQHGLIPAHLNFEQLNPKLANWTIKLPLTTQPFPAAEARPRRAGVSSFGFGGTNVHLILEQAPLHQRTKPPTVETPYLTPNLLILSARSEPALRHMAQVYAQHLAATEDALVDICFTANSRRAQFDHRLSVVAENSRDLQAELLAYASHQATGSLVTGVIEPGQTPKVAFLFTGQGSQYLHMGRQLYETESTFRHTVTQCAELLRQQGRFGRDLIELLYPSTTPNHNDLIENHACAQVVNFVLECALADMWQSWGVMPDVVLGHSLGDFAAAYCAGVFSLADGLRIVTLRGQLMEKAVGAMVLVSASEAEVAPFVSDYPDVVIGVINGPQNIVISGGQANVNEVTERLTDSGFRTRLLQIPIAAHSPLLDPVLQDFEAAFSHIQLTMPKTKVVSSMNGRLVTHELTQPSYWRQHLRNPIRFTEAMQTVAAQGVSLFMELGPKPTLLGMGRQCIDSEAIWLPNLQPPFTDWQTLLHTLGQLFVHGVAFDWDAAEGDWLAFRHQVVLPSYPFQRQSYWVEEGLKNNNSPAISYTLRPAPVSLPTTPRVAPPPDPITLSLREQLATSLVSERPVIVTRFLQDQVRHILRLSKSQNVSLTRPLKELGLDSLMSGEFVAILDKTLQVKLPVQRLMGGGTLDSVAQMVLEKLNLTETDTKPQTVNNVTKPSPSNNLPPTMPETDTTDFHAAAADIPQIHAVVTEQQNRKLKVGDKWVFDFASCNYLGLDLHPEVMAEVLPAIQKWGVHPSWTRAVASPAIYEELEAALANLMGCYSTLVFPAVTLLHAGVIPVLAGYDGVIFKDISAHKSIDEACRLAQTNGAEVVVFKHNDAVDLERRMMQYPLQRTKIIAIDGVYSMSGAYADLPAFARLAKMYNAVVYLDDAHGMGVIGEKPTVEMPYGFKGNGLVNYYGLDYARDRMIYVAGLSKSYSSFGAFITCTDEAMKNKFRSASTFIFSGPSPVASLASAIAGIRLNARDGEIWRRQVYDLTYRLVTEAKKMGFEVVNDNYFPIVGVVIGQTRHVIEACKLLWEGEYGVLITPAIFPIVPLDKGLLRFSITASNTMEEIDYSLAALKAVNHQLKAN